jgi:hypothetical protein
MLFGRNLLIVHIVPDAAIRKFILVEGIVSGCGWSLARIQGTWRAGQPMDPSTDDESGAIHAPRIHAKGRMTSRREETP